MTLRGTALGLVAALALVAVSPGTAPAAGATLVCTSGVPGDVNGDGHAEVAVGEPGNDGGSGAVHLFYGTSRGLVADPSGTARNDQYLTQATPGVPGTSEPDDGFGSATLLSDLNGDGCADLAVGAEQENHLTGAVTVLYGSPTGLRTTGAQGLTENGLFGTGAGADEEGFGSDLAAGDLDGDGYLDLAVGVPGERVSGQAGGAVAVLYGSPTGLGRGPEAAVLVSQATAGVPGAPEPEDRFGGSVAIGDFDGDGVDDLAAGVVGESNSSGVVDVLPGRDGDGVGHRGGTVLQQNTAEVPGLQEGLDGFGSALAAGDVTGDGHDDLAVGIPGENGTLPEPGIGQGAVVLLLGSAGGLTGAGSQLWTQGSPGVEGVSGPEDAFGATLAMGRLDRGPSADLAIGTPRDSVGSVPVAGSVTVLLGTDHGLSTAGSGGRRFTQATPGLPGTVEEEDWFGLSLAASAVQGRDQDNLVVGIPQESVARQQDGMVSQLAASAAGPDAVGGATFHLDTPGVQGVPGDGGFFGAALG